LVARDSLRGLILTMLILLLLAREELHGYGIMLKLRMITQRGIRASPGTIYPLLEKLKKEGYVKSREKNYGGRTRKIYTLTSKGKLLLKNHASRIRNILASIVKLIEDTMPIIEREEIDEEVFRSFMEKEREILLEIRRSIDKRIAEIQAFLQKG